MNTKFIKDNLILLTGLFLNGFFSYIFHFMMGRHLGPIEYGDLNTIIAINYIIFVFFYTIQTSVTQFTSKYKTKGEFGKINSLMRRASKSLFKKSLIISLVFCLIIPPLGKFLNLNNPFILLWLVPIIILSLIYPINRGVLQGLQKFSSLSLSYINEGVIKVASGIILILIGIKLNGAIAAIGLGLVLSYLITFKPLKTILKTKRESIDKKEIYSYSFPALIMILLLTLMFSLDILLVKHFFPEKEAGYYAALAILGKVIFFSINPIVQVMFPKITENKGKRKNYRNILYGSLFLSLIISLGILTIYNLVPDIMINILFGSKYLSIAPLLGLMGLMMTFLSFAYMLCFYNLSLNKNKFIWIILICLLTEVGAIAIFHSSLFEVIKNLTMIMLLFLISMITYSYIEDKKSGQKHFYNNTI